jgi:acyl-coenzyme A thioesterase PaaI-like protein
MTEAMHPWIDPQLQDLRLQAFNRRTEIRSFGLIGSRSVSGDSVVRFERFEPGFLGGGGTSALNGGIIAAGFDAVCVLAALLRYDTDVVVTLTLNVEYLRVAKPGPQTHYRGTVTKRGRHVSFVRAELLANDGMHMQTVATASATLSPVFKERNPRSSRQTSSPYSSP